MRSVWSFDVQAVDTLYASRSIVAKTFKVSDAIASIPDGATLMIGGFMAVGSPRRLIDELVRLRSVAWT